MFSGLTSKLVFLDAIGSDPTQPRKIPGECKCGPFFSLPPAPLCLLVFTPSQECLVMPSFLACASTVLFAECFHLAHLSIRPVCWFLRSLSCPSLPVPLHPLSRVARIYFQSPTRCTLASTRPSQDIFSRSACARVFAFIHTLLFVRLSSICPFVASSTAALRANRVQKLGGLKTGGVDSLKPR